MEHVKKEYNIVFIDASTAVELYGQLNSLGDDGWQFVSWYDEPDKNLKNEIRQAIFIRDLIEHD